ncbi:MAG: hypothetical protein ACXW2L_17735, partial [Burkholderiales bacterium]
TSRELQRARDRLWVAGLRTLTLVTDAEPAGLPLPPDTRVLTRNALGDAGSGALLAAVGATARRSE